MSAQLVTKHMVNPVTGAGLVNPVTGAGLVSPVTGAGLVSPVTGAGLVNPVTGAGLVSPVTGAGLVNPVMVAGLVSPVIGTGQSSHCMHLKTAIGEVMSFLRWDSNPQLTEYQADAVPAELLRQPSWAGWIFTGYTMAKVSLP